MAKTNITVSEEIHRKAKARAALQGKSLGEFCGEALEHHMRRENEQTSR